MTKTDKHSDFHIWCERWRRVGSDGELARCLLLAGVKEEMGGRQHSHQKKDLPVLQSKTF